VFVPERFLGGAAAILDARGELDHLVDGLLAVETHDIVEAKLAALNLRLAGQRWKHLDEHRHHHLRPALADKRERAVEVEKDVADVGARRETRRKFDVTEKGRLHLAVS
jgi:hypothetical protein